MHARQLLGVCATLLATGCLRGNDGGENTQAPPRVWSFANADSEDVLAPKLDRLGLLLAAAERSVALRERPLACASPTAMLGFEAPLTPPPRHLALVAGASCADTVAALRAYYVRSLSVAAGAANVARGVKPDVIYCGSRVTDTQPAADLAAVGRRLEAMDLSKGARAMVEVMAGSNRETVALRSHLTAGCDSAKGECGALAEGMSAWSIDGATDMLADLEGKTVLTHDDYALSYKLTDGKDGGSLSGRLKTQVAFSGLGAGERVHVQEHSEYQADGTGALGLAAAGEKAWALDLTVEELAPGALHVSGNAFGGAVTPEQTPFSLLLTQQDDTCTVDTDALPLREEDVSETVPLTAMMITGDWTSACSHGPLGRLGKDAAFQETLAFHEDLGPKFKHRLVAFTDAECFLGHEAATVDLYGSYKTAALDAPATDLALDYSYDSIAITLSDAALVSAFNQGAVCGHRDWRSGEKHAFDAGACYFDLGSAALLHLDVLKRKLEYTAARATNAVVIDVARTSHFGGDLPELRARVATSTTRKFRKP